MRSTPVIVVALAAFAALRPEAAAQTTIDLGDASDFAVLASAGITISGSATIIGDLGSFPTSITGFGNVSLTGTNHAGDSFTQSAQTALSAAYSMGVGETPSIGDTAQAVFANGTVLAPGVYNAPSTLALSGTITLDGPGTYIFQVGSTIDAASNTQILLTNGAQAASVFWLAGTSATIGSSSEFAGTVLAQDSITLDAGATADGGLLAETASVTLTGDNTVATAIPEPASTALWIAAFAGLIVGARKIRRHGSASFQ